jgi:thymidylate synthase ThyX
VDTSLTSQPSFRGSGPRPPTIETIKSLGEQGATVEDLRGWVDNATAHTEGRTVPVGTLQHELPLDEQAKVRHMPVMIKTHDWCLRLGG